MKQQVLVIHGGDVWNSYEEYIEFLKDYKIDIDKIKDGGWKESLQKGLGDDFEIIYPQMPCKHNAKYAEWKIWFEKFIPYLKDGVILMGGSLGGIFLAKYLSENNFPFKIKATVLIAAPFDKEDEYPLGDFKITESLDRFKNQSEKIILYQSKDDPIVPFSDFEKYSKALPNAENIIFEDRGHFTQKEFPELIEKIKSLE